MKNRKFATVLAISILMMACSKNLSNTDEGMSEPLPPIDTNLTKIVLKGRFENGPYGNTSGKVSILQTGNRFQLRLDSFKVNNGPDLKVYVSKQKQPLDFYRVGSLKAFQGDQVYELNSLPDFPEYSYVLIHCEKFNHLFGAALLMKD